MAALPQRTGGVYSAPQTPQLHSGEGKESGAERKGRWVIGFGPKSLNSNCFTAYQEIAEGDGAVGVDDEAVRTERRRVLELGRYEHTDGGEQLQLRAPDC